MEIRLARAGDAAGIAEIYGPIVESTPTSFEIQPPDEEQIRQRIAKILSTLPWLVCEHGSRVAGYVYASEHKPRPAYQWSVDVSVYVHPKFHRRGIGAGLYASLFQILVAQGYYNAFAGVTLPNAASVGVHESMGFEPIGVYRNVGFKLGRWHDVGWWQLALQPSAGAPRPLIKLTDLQNRPEWRTLLESGTRRIRA